MNERYDQLERLQRLRAGGTLTDEEFEAEKRRLLADPPTVAEADTARRRRFILMGTGAAGLLAAIAAGAWLALDSSGSERVEPVNVAAPEDAGPDLNLLEAAPPRAVHTLSEAEQLARAFEAAFAASGSASVEIGGDAVTFTPGRLLWTAMGPVLVSPGEAPDAPHASGGHIAVHYLRPSGDRFEVAKRFLPAVTSGSSGNLGNWSVSGRFSHRPVIVTEGGGTWQGYSCSILTLTELGPAGPVELASLPLSYSDAGAQEEDEAQATEIAGRIDEVVRDRSFEVSYSGSESFVERYVRQGNKYVREGGGETRMRTC